MYEERTILSMRFPQKLWRIVNACTSGAIRWNEDGSTILLDYKKFQEEYLDGGKSIFKTKNITSFIRQLNLYGFRKVTSHNRDLSCNSHNPNVHEFLHEHFRAGRVDLLSKVCRKAMGKGKCYQRISPLPSFPASPSFVSTLSEVSTTTSQNSTGKGSLSRLQMCQLALTETLEQISQECQRKFWNVSTIDNKDCSFSSPSTADSEILDFDLFAIARRRNSSTEANTSACCPFD